MTQNDKISEIMGWSKDSHELHILDEFNDEPEANRFAITKLLQAKMVADDFIVEIREYKLSNGSHYFKSCAERIVYDKKFYQFGADSESAALHALFCKVYNIGGKR